MISALEPNRSTFSSPSAGRLIVMLACYLDDSGASDKSIPFATLGGYVAYKPAWEVFEPKARAYLASENVTCIHGKEFYSNDGEFKGWKVQRRIDFLEGLYDLFRPVAELGITHSCLKETHAARKADTGLGKNQSPLGFSFAAILNAVVDDPELGRDAKFDGIEFILEDGNNNNSGIIKSYSNIKRIHKADFLKEIRVVGKRDCVAVQMADLMAFFSRRHTCQMHANNREPIEMDKYLKIMVRGIRNIGHASIDFGG
jgi:Protein of unknown function (DUF3800)